MNLNMSTWECFIPFERSPKSYAFTRKGNQFEQSVGSRPRKFSSCLRSSEATHTVRTKVAASDQAGFTHYAREQLVLMKQMQALQNAQTSIVARRNMQLEQMAVRQLPPPQNDQPAIIFGDDIFEDLDDLEIRR